LRGGLILQENKHLDLCNACNQLKPLAKIAKPEETAMQITATEAKNRFGSICALAKRAPVFVEKAGQIDTVIMSADQYRELQANQNNSSLASRKKKFEAEFGEWIAAQNTWVEKQGVPGSDLRPW
jgi:PHD/YefM family antitoxin component YafN of YafNO toxin-antitoxin module